MKRLFLLTVMLLILSALTFGQIEKSNTDKQSKNSKIEQQIIQLENKWRNAYVKKDIPTFSNIYSDAFVFTTPDGQSHSKAIRINEIKNRPDGVLQEFSLNNPKVVVSGDTAVVTGLVNFYNKFPNQPTLTKWQLLYTGVYVKEGKNWRLLAAHSSQAPQQTATR